MSTRKTESMAREKILDLLVPSNNQSYQCGNVFQCAAASTDGASGLWFATVNNTLSIYNTLNCGQHLKDIAFALNTAAMANVLYTLKSSRCRYILQSQDTGNINLEAYLIKVRRDIPNSQDDIRDTIGRGFATNGHDVTDPNKNNAYMTQINTGLFQSQDFCLDYKVLKTRRTILKPGQQKSFNIVNNFSREIRPNRFIQMTSGQTFNTGTLLFSRFRGDRFYLFRIYGQLAVDSAIVGNSTFTAPKINMLSQFQYEYKWIQDNIANINAYQASGLFANTTPRFVTQNTLAPVVEQTA